MEILNDDVIRYLNKNAHKLNHRKGNFFANLLDKNNTKVSTTNFFVVAMTIIGFLLLLVPVAAILVELFTVKTVTMNWGDMAAFVGAVSTMFIGAGITKAWSNYSNDKAKAAKYQAMADTGSFECNFDDEETSNEDEY